MGDLIVVTYPDKFRAAEVMATLSRLQVEHLIDLEEACYVTNNDGKVKIHQTIHLTADGALNGGFWGMLIGMLFLNPILGGLIGAGAGALSGAASDYGISDDFIRSLSRQMQPDSSGIFILVTKITPDKVLVELSKYGGTILRTSFTTEIEAQWQTSMSASANTVPS